MFFVASWRGHPDDCSYSNLDSESELSSTDEESSRGALVPLFSSLVPNLETPIPTEAMPENHDAPTPSLTEAPQGKKEDDLPLLKQSELLPPAPQEPSLKKVSFAKQNIVHFVESYKAFNYDVSTLRGSRRREKEGLCAVF